MKVGSWNSSADSVYFIAEAGVNHNGDVAVAKRLVDAAADAGADAVKFQTFRADRLVTESAPTAEYQKETTGDETQRSMLQELELTESEHESLKEYCAQAGVDFLSTPFGGETAGFLDSLGVHAFKIGSGDLTNHPLLRKIATYGKPMIVSTGMSTLEEVEEAFSEIRDANSDVPVALLHCVSAYPTELDDVNLRAIATLREAFSVPVGFSDHTTEIETPALATAAGAQIVEKHFTLNRERDGPDHDASLEPPELERAISLVRNATSALGDGKKKPVPAEEDTRSVSRKGLYASEPLSPGDELTESAVAIKRPPEGLAPAQYTDVLGRTISRDVARDEPLTEACFKEE